MIGSQTGKIVGYSVRNKFCRQCDNATERNQLAPPHNCKRNWTGSSKSIEPDMVVDLIGQAVQKGVQIEGLVADDDTTVMSRVHGICSNIQEMSDKNHIKKTYQTLFIIFKKCTKICLQK